MSPNMSFVHQVFEHTVDPRVAQVLGLVDRCIEIRGAEVSRTEVDTCDFRISVFVDRISPRTTFLRIRIAFVILLGWIVASNMQAPGKRIINVAWLDGGPLFVKVSKAVLVTMESDDILSSFFQSRFITREI